MQKRLVGLPHDYKILLSCGGKLFIRDGKAGLMQMVPMENGGLKTVPVAGGETFAGKKIYMMAPYKSDRPKLLIGTYQDGLYIHDGKTAKPFAADVDDYLKKNKLYHGIRLSSGDFALATILGGLVIMTPQGRLKYIFDTTTGLQDDKVYYVFEDNRGNLWLCLSKGISKIEYTSPISVHDKRSNLSGLVLSVIKHRDNLYVGTSKGLYSLESPFKFRLIPGINGDCWSLLSTRDAILAAASEGVFQVDGKNRGIRKVIQEQSFALLPSVRYPGRTWCGTSRGLVTLSVKNGRWREEYRFKNIDQGIRSIAEDKNGNLWLGTLTGSVFKVDFTTGENQPVVIPYGTSHGLPGGEIYIAEAAGHVMFATGKGIFQFDELNKIFIPDHTLGDEFAGGPGSKNVFRLAEDKHKNIWFHSEFRNFLAMAQQGRIFVINKRPFLRIPQSQVNTIYPDPLRDTVW
ncbi:MAG: hypothetical protein GY950_12705, partial [bacterium]|nr:hypothetical protein [bacterium]